MAVAVIVGVFVVVTQIEHSGNTAGHTQGSQEQHGLDNAVGGQHHGGQAQNGTDHIQNSYRLLLGQAHIDQAMMDLRKFMFDHVYLNSVAKKEEGKVERMITMLYQYYEKHVDQMPQEYIDLIRKKGQPEQRVVCDYISGMTDQYSISRFQELFVPQAWQKM